MCLKIDSRFLEFSSPSHPPFSILLTGLVRTPLQIYEYKAKHCDSDLLGVVEESGGQEQKRRCRDLGWFSAKQAGILGGHSALHPRGLPFPSSSSWALTSSTAPGAPGLLGPRRQAPQQLRSEHPSVVDPSAPCSPDPTYCCLQSSTAAREKPALQADKLKVKSHTAAN